MIDANFDERVETHFHKLWTDTKNEEQDKDTKIEESDSKEQIEIGLEELEEALKIMRNSRAPGEDGIAAENMQALGLRKDS
mgnify:CR=1 FL=1